MTAVLTACHECDALQRTIPVSARATVRCVRCDALLYRADPSGPERALAYSAGAAVLLVMANVFPLVGLRVSGELIETTVFGAAQMLYANGMRTLGAVVFVTTVAAPLIELVAVATLLVALRSPRLAQRASQTYRVLRSVQPWGMVEVMMLGVLVALVKLAGIAEIVPGVALWSLAALVVVTAARSSAFDPRAPWPQLDVAR